MAVHTSPALLKQRVGTARTYIRPVQRDLDMTPVAENNIDVVSIISTNRRGEMTEIKGCVCRDD